MVTKIIVVTIGVLASCFLLLIAFAVVGPLVPVIAVFVGLGLFYAKWGRNYDKTWRADRGLSDNLSERVKQVSTGDYGQRASQGEVAKTASGSVPADSFPAPRGLESLVRFSGDTIHLSVSSTSEARLALKELQLRKKALSLTKRQILEQERMIRAGYTDHVRRQGSKFRGGGGVGRFVRTVQTAQRDSTRGELAKRLGPLEKQRAVVEAQMVAIEKAKLQLEGYLIKLQPTK